MIPLVQKTHQLYLIIEVSALTVVSLAACIFLSVHSVSTEGNLEVTNLDNFSTKWVFTLPKGFYPAVYIKQTADIKYSSTNEIETWPFNAQINSEFKDDTFEDTFAKMKVEVNGNIGKPIVFFDKDFASKSDPVFTDRFVTRNPLIEKIKITLKYAVPIDTRILGFFGFVFLAFIPKAIFTDILVVLYALAFLPQTAEYSGAIFALFCGFYVVVMFRHTEKHTISTSKFNNLLNPVAWTTFALFGIYAMIRIGFTPFQISQAPFVILGGMCIVQITGLIAFSQLNIPIMFDFVGSLCVYLPYVLQIFLPIYFQKIEAAAITRTATSVLGLMGVMCSILSEGMLERDDVVSEDVMGVIARETSSSSGEMVTIERDDSLKIGKVRRINPISLTIVALPCIFGIIAIFIAQLTALSPAEFSLIKED